jgi:uncharacterized membrane protein YphA (DoxX/SURF4 family)
MKRGVTIILRILLAAVFLYAGYSKLRQPWLLFAMSIDAYGFLPEWAVLFVARTLPWAEVALGALLLAGWGLRYSSTVSAVLLSGFFLTMLAAFAGGKGIDCGCFGLGEALTAKTLARDGALVSGAVALAILSIRQERSKAS